MLDYYDEDEDEARRRREREGQPADENVELIDDQRYRDVPKPKIEPVEPVNLGKDTRGDPSDSYDAKSIIDRLSSKYGVSAGETDVANLAGKNPEDRARFEGELAAQFGRRARSTGGGTNTRPPTTAPPLANAYGNYLNTGEFSGYGTDWGPIIEQFQQQQREAQLYAQQQVAELRAQQQAERDRQQAERAALRELISGRLTEASKPVDATAPGIKEILASQRLARQRASERQRSQVAVRLGEDNLGDSGAFDTAISGIEQQRGEGEASDIADVLGREHQAKRQELLQLYQMAVASGDAEMARNVQQQLAVIDAAIQRQQLGDIGSRFGLEQAGINSRFGADLGFRKSSFLDNLSLQIMLAQLGANERAAGAFF